MMGRGEFREDLYYRLSEVIIRVPPLRQRPGDTVLLANHFLNRFGGELGRRGKRFGSNAVAALVAHDWPGNVRELENRVKRAVIMSEGRVIEPGDMELATPTAERADLDIRAARARAEREVITLALAQSNGVISGAAKLLGVSRPTLYALMESLGIVPAPEPPGAGESGTH